MKAITLGVALTLVTSTAGFIFWLQGEFGKRDSVHARTIDTQMEILRLRQDTNTSELKDLHWRLSEYKKVENPDSDQIHRMDLIRQDIKRLETVNLNYAQELILLRQEKRGG